MAQFTEQLFVYLILPHIEGKSLLTMRQLSKTIKPIANRQLLAFIGSETKRIKGNLGIRLPNDYNVIWHNPYMFNSAWYPKYLDKFAILLHFNVFHEHHVIAFKYNIISAKVTMGMRKLAQQCDFFENFVTIPQLVGDLDLDEIIVKQFQ